MKPGAVDRWRNITAALSLMCLSVFPGLPGLADTRSGERQDFSLSLSLTREEISKDSNSQKTLLTIRGDVLEYSFESGGRDPRKPRKKRYILTKEFHKRLIDFLQGKRLNRRVQEIKPQNSPGIFIDLRLKMTIAGKTTDSHLAGALRQWGDGGRKGTSMENIAYYHAVHSLLVFLKRELKIDAIEI